MRSVGEGGGDVRGSNKKQEEEIGWEEGGLIRGQNQLVLKHLSKIHIF